jgi:hypothetical protein
MRIILSVLVFLLFYAAIISSIVLVSAGILAIPVALAAISGVFTNIASDLSPPAMLLAGISCISAGLALALAVVMFFPKQPNILLNLKKSRK